MLPKAGSQISLSTYSIQFAWTIHHKGHTTYQWHNSSWKARRDSVISWDEPLWQSVPVLCRPYDQRFLEKARVNSMTIQTYGITTNIQVPSGVSTRSIVKWSPPDNVCVNFIILENACLEQRVMGVHRSDFSVFYEPQSNICTISWHSSGCMRPGLPINRGGSFPEHSH